MLNKLEIVVTPQLTVKIYSEKSSFIKKQIIEQFLPRFGSDCTVLYIGDTSNKSLHIEIAELKKLHFFELSHDELPDIIAYSKKKNWLYLIEAVHSSGPMSETRMLELKKMLRDCKAELIFVTAFLTRSEFKKWLVDIAWESEVWIADNPDHLVHFNGHKFLGSYKQ
jgi:type II restriction enzyme